MAFDEERQIQWWLTGNIEGLVAAMLTAQRTVKEGTDGISGAFGSMGGSVNKFIGVFGTLTGIVAGGAAFKAIVSETNSWNLEAVKLSKTLGITTQEASVLNLALGDVYLSIDTMQAASALLTRNSLKNAEAFKHYRIDLKDANLEQRSTLAIMADVNDKLLSIKEGRNREIAGMQLYGRGWTEVSGIIKLNGEVMREAQEKAERLHLIVGPEGIEKTKKYRAAMNDLEDVTKSVKVQVGNELLPVLAELGVQMEGPATKAAGVLAGALEGVNEAIKKYKKEGSGGWKNFLVPFQKVDPNAWKDMSDMTMAGVPLPGATKSGQSGVTPYTKDTGPSATDQLYQKYTLELDNLNKKIAESNPYLDSHGKALSAVDGEVKKLSDEMPEYAASWQAYGAAMKQNIVLAEQLKTATEEYLDYAGSNESFLNFTGQMSKSQQQQFDQAASLSEWAAKREESRRQELQAGAQFYAMTDQNADHELQQELARITAEQEAWERSWAMMAETEEEYERRRLLIKQRSDKQREHAEGDHTMRMLQYSASGFGSMASIADSFYQLSGKKSKAAFRAYQVMKGGEIVVTTADTAMKAYDAMASIPYIGPALGAAAAAAAIAYGAVQEKNLWSASADGGGSIGGGSGDVASGFPGATPVTQPIANQQPPVPANTTIVLKGIPNGKWIEEELIPGLDEAGRRNIRIEYVPA